MIVWLVTFIFFVLWGLGKRVPAMILLFSIACGFFYLQGFPDPVLSSEYHNSLYLIGNTFLAIEIYKNKFNRIKKDKIARFILLFYIFFILHSFFTIVLSIDSARYATALLRTHYSPFLLYFVLMNLGKHDSIKTLHILFIICVIHSFLYILQFMGIDLFQGEFEVRDVVRRGMPYYGCLFFFYAFSIRGNKKWLLACLILVPFLGGSARGVIVSIFFACVLYYRGVVFKSLKNFVLAGILGIGLIVVYNLVLSDNFTRRGRSGFVGDVTGAFNWENVVDYSNSGSIEENGTFVFRIALLAERIIYLINNPGYIPFGCGSIEEVSPNNHMYFLIGTYNESTRYGRTMIETNDILWPPYIIRYGICGILFWVMFFTVLYRRYNKSPYESLKRLGILWVLFCVFQSFGTDWVRRAYLVLPMLILAIAVQKNLKRNDSFAF